MKRLTEIRLDETGVNKINLNRVDVSIPIDYLLFPDKNANKLLEDKGYRFLLQK